MLTGQINTDKNELFGTISNKKAILSGTVSPIETVNGSLSSLGIRGYSAYELAVKHGYKGTEEQWIDDLKGEKIEIKQENNMIYWKYATQTEWLFLINLTSTKDYSKLINKPMINTVELNGDLSLAELGIQSSGDYIEQNSIELLSNWEIEKDFKF